MLWIWGWRYNLHTPDRKFTRQIRVLVQLVWALLWHDPCNCWIPSQKVHQRWLPSTNLRHLHHCTRPSNTWNIIDVTHKWDHPLFPVALRQLSPKCPETLRSGKAVPSKPGQPVWSRLTPAPGSRGLPPATAQHFKEVSVTSPLCARASQSQSLVRLCNLTAKRHKSKIGQIKTLSPLITPSWLQIMQCAMCTICLCRSCPWP